MPIAEFCFHLTFCDEELLLPQVCRALERRTEMLSREKYPALWRYTDRGRVANGRKNTRASSVLPCVLCLAGGIFLLVPGLMKPAELTVPLIAGVIAAFSGIIGLTGLRKKRKNPFEDGARKLLSGMTASEGETVIFSEAGMTMPTDSGETETVSPNAFSCVIEEADVLLLVFDKRAMLLRKQDLTEGEMGRLCGLLETWTPRFSPYS